jgi:hypothetical protein
VAAIFNCVATRHLRTTLSSQQQPDILTLHIDFLKGHTLGSGIVTVVDLKLGRVTSTIQLAITQGDSKAPTAVALVTSTNFDVSVGPSADTTWTLTPAPKPLPDFAAIAKRQRDPNWVAYSYEEAFIPFSTQFESLTPRGGQVNGGIADQWTRYRHEVDGARLSGPEVAFLADSIPSIPDSLLKNGAVFDTGRITRETHALDARNPGSLTMLKQTMEDLITSTVFNSTIVLDIAFKRRTDPLEGKGGIEGPWAFVRGFSKAMKDGRTDLELVIMDDKMEVIAVASQVIYVLEPGRNIRRSRKDRSSGKL